MRADADEKLRVIYKGHCAQSVRLDGSMSALLEVDKLRDSRGSINPLAVRYCVQSR